MRAPAILVGLSLLVMTWGGPSFADDEGAGDVPGGVSPDVAKEAGRRLFKAAQAKAQASCGAALNPKTGVPDGPFGPLTFDVALSHRTGTARVVGMDASFRGHASGDCVAGIFNQIKLPPWKGPDITVHYWAQIPSPKK